MYERPSLSHLRVLGIAGSLREHSFSHLTLKYALSLAQSSGCCVELFDLRTNPLPMCNGDKEDPRLDYPAVAHLRDLASSAHALILATPEYHGGMSGVLKNALDLLEIKHLEGKVVGCISVLGGPTNCNALNDLRQVMRWCHAWVIPEQIAIGRARDVLAAREIRDPDLQARFEAFVHGLLQATLRLNDCFLPKERLTDLCRTLPQPEAYAAGSQT